MGRAGGEPVITRERARKIFNEVFDENTVTAVHRLASRGVLDALELLINAGKEAHVYLARDAAGHARAVKIYKVGTTDFKNMWPYLDGDWRFEGVKKKRHEVIEAWARKEYKNLQRLAAAGVAVPAPLAVHRNVLVMGFVGEDGKAAPQARDAPPADPAAWYRALVEALARMVNRARLVHADLSPYNLLNHAGRPVVIDVGQAVLTSHPRAEAWFARDCANLAKWFAGLGLKTTAEKMRYDARKAARNLA